MAPPLAGPSSARRVAFAVALTALVVYLGALANRFAMDDVPLIVQNPLVGTPAGLWRTFVSPYWPADLGADMYRPIPVVTWGIDRLVDGAPWYHLVNLLWHAAASTLVAALAWRIGGGDHRTALIAGLLFAVHPVHVEAVANLVGRAELMAAVFVVLAAYAALVRQRVGWAAAAWAAGLLCKENAAVLPALVVWGWVIGFGRPSRSRMMAFAGTWVAVGVLYGVVRWFVLHPYAGYQGVGPIFLGVSPAVVRLTGIAALADVGRLLVFPLTLRVDYSPAERTVVTSLGDVRLALGLVALLVWGVLLVLAWRRDRKTEAFGLGWIGIALLPVANLLFPAGFLLAERTLYLPSIGLTLAAGAWLARLQRPLVPVAALVLLGGVRTALRVPVWRDNTAVTISIINDSPRSYVGPKRMTAIYLDLHEPAKALHATQLARGIYDRDPTIYVTGAVAAFAAGEPRAADSLLAALERLCHHCVGYYRHESAIARAHGYPEAADSLLARARVLEAR